MTLTDIVGYLPHGLVGVSATGDITEINIAYMSWHGVNSMGHKPVLLPMIDLISEITEKGYNDGKPFVPIAKIAGVLFRGRFNFQKIERDDCIELRSKYKSIYIKNYEHDIKYKDWASPRRAVNLSDNLIIFDLLHRWHFDYRGLIEAGYAVNVHNLKNNPYEN